LLLRLLADGCTVVLDKGAGEEELARADRMIEAVRGYSYRVGELNAEMAHETQANLGGCSLLTWQGEIGAFAALIGASDEYIGYDSAGQHIAAALGIPAVDVFMRDASAVFRERWTPSGRAAVHVVVAAIDSSQTVQEILTAHNRLRHRI
jgi:ADP-heptose:LPS heptosyltransferase